jgi:hypothetical protein
MAIADENVVFAIRNVTHDAALTGNLFYLTASAKA